MALVAGCGQKPAVPPTERPTVAVIEVAPRVDVIYDEMPGRVVASDTAEIRPQVSGIVIRRLFEQGSTVKAGQALFQVNSAPYDADVDMASAALRQAEATSRRADIAAGRLRDLAAQDAVSHQVYDDAVATAGEARAAVDQAKATLERKRVDQGFTTIRSPIGGQVGAELVMVGALVAPGDTTPMARVQDIDHVYIDARQPHSLMRLPRAGDTSARQAATDVQVLGPDGNATGSRARVIFEDRRVDENTGDAVLRIRVDNGDRVLLPGMFVRVRVPREAPTPMLHVPQQAVRRDAQGAPYVFVVDREHRAQRIPITVGPISGDEYIVLRGLRSGARVVVEGGERTQDKGIVEDRPWKNPGTQAPAPTYGSS